MIEFADWNMRPELSELWQKCFHEPQKYPDYFLGNIFSPRDCLVYRVGGKIAAVVYFIPAYILVNGNMVQAHYIFAAATEPSFRCRGYMSSLLAYASVAGAERGDHFSALLPSGESLYHFYEKSGYSSPFFVRRAEVPAERLQTIALHGGWYECMPSAECLNRLRRKCLFQYSGSFLWDDRMFRLSISLSRVYGDQLICVQHNGTPAYALCRKENNICTALETMADNNTFPALAAALLKKVPARQYRFRLPMMSPLFHGEGITERFGMLKPLGRAGICGVKTNAPYLGLGMD